MIDWFYCTFKLESCRDKVSIKYMYCMFNVDVCTWFFLKYYWLKWNFILRCKCIHKGRFCARRRTVVIIQRIFYLSVCKDVLHKDMLPYLWISTKALFTKHSFTKSLAQVPASEPQIVTSFLHSKLGPCVRACLCASRFVLSASIGKIHKVDLTIKLFTSGVFSFSKLAFVNFNNMLVSIRFLWAVP